MSFRKLEYKQKFAHIVGGEDEDGVFHRIDKDPEKARAKKKQHLFWVKHRDIPGASGHSVLGDTLMDYINEDKYEIEYLGKHEHWKSNKNLLKKVKEQIDDQEAAKKATDRSNGVFREDEFYKNRATERKKEVEANFKIAKE